MGSIVIRGGNWVALKKFQYWWKIPALLLVGVTKELYRSNEDICKNGCQGSNEVDIH